MIAAQTPGVELADFAVLETHIWGSGQVSSAGRIVIEPAYAAGSPADLPRRLVLKVAKTAPDSPDRPNPTAGAGGTLYQNEVNIYRRLVPASFLEAPRVFGGIHDRASNSLLLVMEDLRDRDATFANVTVPVSLRQLESLLDQLAMLHARYWNSPELKGSLGWMETHLKGAIHDQFNAPQIMAKFIDHQVETEQFKREMVERLGVTPADLFRQFQAVQRHQGQLPQTVCHGDTHVGNTYLLPDARGGLLDWQLTSQGYAMHDVSYLIATALSVADRRLHERDMLGYYLERLRLRGVTNAGSFDDVWTEYRRSMVWGVYIGWLTTPVVNYGWEITVMAHLRTMTAYDDLETRKLADALT
jgi:thiamine kinase-like enzyme